MTPPRMTALEQYIRLEAIGLWRETPEAEPREVVVSFGNATLVLTDMSDRPLTHWALAGTRPLRIESGATVYSITADGAETLTVRDPDMVAAIAAVTAAARFPGPRSDPPRRRFRWVKPLVALVAAAVLVALAPGAIAWQAARMLPPETAQRYGDEMLLQIIARHGAPCSEPAGARALSKIADRLGNPDRPRLRVLSLGGGRTAVLPGGYVLLDRVLLAEAESAEEIAGWVALTEARTAGPPPAQALMADTGVFAALRFILTGRLGDPALARAAEAALSVPIPPAPETLVGAEARLAAAALPSEALAAAMNRAGIPTRTAISDLGAAVTAAAPLLSEAEVAALRGICD